MRALATYVLWISRISTDFLWLHIQCGLFVYEWHVFLFTAVEYIAWDMAGYNEIWLLNECDR
jgi:hypothetical protein